MKGVALALMLAAFTSAGCAVITVKHEVPPIYATVDVNIRIQRQLEDVFDFEEPRAQPAGQGAQAADVGEGGQQ